MNAASMSFSPKAATTTLSVPREKGNQNEIDLVAVNDLEKRLVIAEIKLNKARINPEVLKKKAEKLLDSYQGYEVSWLGLGLEDAGNYL